jgi:hypothetical protein
VVVPGKQVNEFSMRADAHIWRSVQRRGSDSNPSERRTKRSRERMFVDRAARSHNDLVLFSTLRRILYCCAGDGGNRVELDADVYTARGGEMTQVGNQPV